MKRAGWIEGKAVDADTGQPIRLSQLVVCNFERKPDGEVVLNGCRSTLEQTLPGQFRASYPVPDEYHLTLSAVGYHDAEAFTPKVTELKTIDGIVVKMKKKTDGSKPELAKHTLSGTVKRDGQPVKVGWVSLWTLRRLKDPVNAPVSHGRMVAEQAYSLVSAPIHDGRYSLELLYQGGNYVVVHEPGHAITQIAPVVVARNENKILDIDCVEGGRIQGHVKGVPKGWQGSIWVVAFGRTGVQTEVRVDRDGSFTLPALPPGEYGLKAGHDAYEDAETYPGKLAMEHPESFNLIADAWKQAKVVKVESGKTTEGVEVEWPR